MERHQKNKIINDGRTIVSLRNPFSMGKVRARFAGRIRPLVLKGLALITGRVRRDNYSSVDLFYPFLMPFTFFPRLQTLKPGTGENHKNVHIFNIYNYYKTLKGEQAHFRDRQPAFEGRHDKMLHPAFFGGERGPSSHGLKLMSQGTNQLKLENAGETPYRIPFLSPVTGALRYHQSFSSQPGFARALLEGGDEKSASIESGRKEETVSYFIRRGEFIQPGIKSLQTIQKSAPGVLSHENDHIQMRNLRMQSQRVPQNQSFVNQSTLSQSSVVPENGRQGAASGGGDRIPLVNRIADAMFFPKASAFPSGSVAAMEIHRLTHRNREEDSFYVRSRKSSGEMTVVHSPETRDYPVAFHQAALEKALAGPLKPGLKRMVSEFFAEMNGSELRSLSDTIYRNLEKRYTVEKDRKGF